MNAQPAERVYRDCPVCGKRGVDVRADGRLGRHRTPYIARETSFCDGEPSAGRKRRVTVQFEANVPDSWSSAEVVSWARSLLTDGPVADEVSAVSVGVIV